MIDGGSCEDDYMRNIFAEFCDGFGSLTATVFYVLPLVYDDDLWFDALQVFRPGSS